MADWEGGRYDDAEKARPGGFFSTIESPEQAVMNLSFVVLLAAISWGVLSRYVVPTPATWVEEISGMSFAWLIFIGAAEVHRRNQHVSVDLLTNLLPDPIRRALAYAMEVLVIAYCFYVAYLGVKQTIVMHSSLTSMLRIPLSIAYAGFTAGIFLTGLRGALRLVGAMRRQGGER